MKTAATVPRTLFPVSDNVVATNTGFKSSNRPDVSLQVGMVARINFVLEVGDATQLVEVTAGAPLLSTESTALGTVIENRRIVELPLNGRNYLQLVALSPNVTTEGGAGGPGGLQGGERSRTSLSIAGRGSSSTATLSTASRTPMRISIRISSSHPSMPFRSSRFKQACTRRSLAVPRRRSAPPRNPAPTSFTGPHLSSCAITFSTRKSGVRMDHRTRFDEISLASHSVGG